MKYPDTKIEAVCPKKDGRYYLLQPYLDVEAGKLIATNGNAMAILDVTDTAGELSGPVPIDAFKRARDKSECVAAGLDLTAPDVVKMPVSGATMPRGDSTITYPDWARVLPAASDSDIVFGIDAALLLRLADALKGRNSKDRVVQLRLKLNAKGEFDNGCIRVEAGEGVVGAIMPCRY